MGDAGDLTASITSGATTALAVTDDALERAEAAAGLNAFTRLDPDGARRAALRVDEIVARRNDPGLLAGVPVALKDLVDQQGIPTTAGSSFLDAPAAADATVVTRLRQAGAVIVGRTGLHEFAYGFSSENHWWGPVRNPWNTSTSPGGSSGGSAAAVAAGITPLGIGTDTGGSVRVPAALCGLAGLKVTHGRISLNGVFPLAPSLDTVGPLARTVADVAASYLVMSGHDPDDGWSADLPVEPAADVDLRGLRFAVPHPWVDRPIAAEQRSGLDRFVEGVRSLGAAVEDIDAPALDQRDLPVASYAEVADVHRTWFSDDPTRYGPEIQQRLESILSVGASEIEAALEWRSRLVDTFAAVLGEFDFIITPSTAAYTKSIGRDTIDVGEGPEAYRPVLAWFTPLVNQAGLPALAVPIEDPDVPGLPPSVQVIAPAWTEPRLLGLGRALDSAGLLACRRPPNLFR